MEGGVGSVISFFINNSSFLFYQLHPHQPPHQPQLYQLLEPELDHRSLHDELESLSGKFTLKDTKLSAQSVAAQFKRLSSYSISGMFMSILLFSSLHFLIHLFPNQRAIAYGKIFSQYLGSSFSNEFNLVSSTCSKYFLNQSTCSTTSSHFSVK